jgi:hypothetical protein
MSKQERLSGPQLLLEYAKDELDAAGLYVAATLAADAMFFVEDELGVAKSNHNGDKDFTSKVRSSLRSLQRNPKKSAPSSKRARSDTQSKCRPIYELSISEQGLWLIVWIRVSAPIWRGCAL